MVTQLASGHCLCGAIHFEADAEPLSVGLCHCESCRRHTGSVVTALVTYPKNAVRWSGAEPIRYRSSPSVGVAAAARERVTDVAGRARRVVEETAAAGQEAVRRELSAEEQVSPLDAKQATMQDGASQKRAVT